MLKQQNDMISGSKPPIDRYVLVTRHNPVLNKVDIFSPLSVGNGELAFTADVTGLQTFSHEYAAGQPLCTQSQWGWHTNPKPGGMSFEDYRLDEYETPHGRQGFPLHAQGQKALYTYLRQNPHRLHLGRIGLRMTRRDGGKVLLQNITAIHQILDLWTGILSSRFSIEGQTVVVRTACHPHCDRLAFSIESPLIRSGQVGIEIDFPGALPGPGSKYPGETREGESPHPDTWSEYITAADWSRPDLHTTVRCDGSPNHTTFLRILDEDKYFMRINWESPAKLEPMGSHTYLLRLDDKTNCLNVVCEFRQSPFRGQTPDSGETFEASTGYWQTFWQAGGAIELIESKDSRAYELERRVVLSQYLTAIHCSGSIPPQETGLMNNSWYGKYNLEMHWWHAFHFPFWNRTQLLERSLWWYQVALPRARRMAAARGFGGARWVKAYGPQEWEYTMPSVISPVLIWCQPHPISYAEVCYNTHPTRQTLEQYQELVFETAEYMASFAAWDKSTHRYVLGPPIAPAQETYPIETVLNPTFELSYWRFGLEIAQQWRERLGLERKEKWEQVINNLAQLPVHDGVYIGHEHCPETFTAYNWDHPSMLASFGVLPGKDVDTETMRRTLHKVLNEWDLEKQSWGWDYPMIAMTAARLGEPEIAVSILLSDLPQNKFLVNGHNRTRDDLPCYLPANGALLIATAMMAAGWEGGPNENAPGFPQNVNWTVRWEGLKPWM